ncbi:MAG: hypothetical protein A3D65_02010 [Candidatus Lloydbacteria bacterium RIFCSPHIGHO2_02_FULL_50_13]|uniref:Uncharacterized protein n=1 Tax=Candidatus Lloydbacteria bacterium RIFCSPHIGHO2_02_FULL_50_13 TaxID=1798661 RepID=A0A1G2CZ67_9BACT|nr:MAG: hypothetical protein A3D65_02010 [Candidatus Lloydbacteria bacterium RIFCSPHIGHO2_02_FULL_50_13]
MGNHVTDRPATLKQRWAIVSDVLVPALLDAPITYVGADAILKTKNKSKKVAGNVLGSIGITLAAKHPAGELLEQYFHKVFGHTIDLAGIDFPEKKGFGTWMAVPPELDEDKIMECLTKHFKVSSYAWKTPVALNIDRAKEQRRPSSLYVFAHRGGDEPDDVHRNKSYDRAMAEGFPFANPKEYLLMTGFHRYVEGYFMDKKGWTRTSSLFSDGNMVYGHGDDDGAKLHLSQGCPRQR